jgi:hypothetical protein
LLLFPYLRFDAKGKRFLGFVKRFQRHIEQADLSLLVHHSFLLSSIINQETATTKGKGRVSLEELIFLGLLTLFAEQIVFSSTFSHFLLLSFPCV